MAPTTSTPLQRLHTAIVAAYNPQSLAQLVSFKLAAKLFKDFVAPGLNFSNTVFKFIEALEEHGKILTFINAVRADRPDQAPFQAELSAIRSQFQSSTAPTGPNLHQLPPNPIHSGFVGREKDLEILRQLPPSGTVLTGLRGMGGIGKTALGLVLAYEWYPQFPDAQFWLDGQGMQAVPTTPEALLAKVIQTFHPTHQLPAELAALQEIYRQTLSGQRVLIVLGNAKDAAQARPLIPPAGCGFIVTSRNNILLGTKAAYSVDRLPDADAAGPSSITSSNWSSSVRSGIDEAKEPRWATSATPTLTWETPARPSSITTSSWSSPVRSGTDAEKATRCLIPPWPMKP